MSKKSIIKGTMILTVAGLATKFLGFYNRIFLTRLIGVKELGVYQLIFPVYMLAFSFCCQGISTTLTKQVSYYIGKKEAENGIKVFRLSLFISFSLGMFAYFIINILSEPISVHILKNSDCDVLLKIISLAIPFVSIKTCINSYFVGINLPGYQGISHFIEQLIRILSAYILSALFMSNYINATLAVIAVISGEIFATILSVIFYIRYKIKHKITYQTIPHHQKQKIPAKNKHIRHDSGSTGIYRDFMKDAVPITSTNLMLTLFSSLEAIILPAMLYKYYLDNDTAMELYGIITGIVIPFLLFPATITTSLSTMLLPELSCANAQNKSKKIISTIKYCVIFCLILGIATTFLYLVFGQWACEFAFKSSDAGILLRQMCFLCPFIYISSILSAILNALDQAFKNLIINITGLVIRIFFTMFLVPGTGLSAYVTGMSVSYITMIIMMYHTIKDLRKIKKAT